VRDYGSNSNKGKETPIDGTAAPKEKVITKVTTGEVVVHKKTVGKKVKEALIGADTKSVAIFVLTREDRTRREAPRGGCGKRGSRALHVRRERSPTQDPSGRCRVLV
jgi:hypothetical protein